MSGGGSKGEREDSTRVQIPDFLQPFLNQATRVAGQSLGTAQQLSGNDQVADLTPEQLEALGMAANTARGEGGFFDTAQNTFLNAAQGQGLDFLDPTSLAALTGGAGGGLNFLPQIALQTLAEGTQGQIPEVLRGSTLPGSVGDVLGGTSQVGVPDSALPQSVLDILGGTSGVGVGQAVPDVATNALTQAAGGFDPTQSGLSPDVIAALSDPGFAAQSGLPQSVIDALSGGSGLNQTGMDALTTAAQGLNLPEESLNALTNTARGDFLYGGEGFDQAVEAAMRAAQPTLNSVFGRTTGGVDSGLAQTALGTAGIDAFARQFAQERGNQLSAADTLAGRTLQNTQTSLGAADSLNQLGLADRGQGIQAAGLLGNLGISDQARMDQTNLANRGLDINQAQALGGLGLSDADMQNRFDLANLGVSQDAARALGGFGLSEQDLLSRVGLSNRGLDVDSASRLGQLGISDQDLLSRIGLANRGLDVDAASRFGNLSLSDAGLRSQGDFANRGLNLDAANSLAGFGGDAANRSLNAGNILSTLSDAERQRQLAAAGILPEIGLMDSQALFGVGETLQNQQQRELSGPLNTQLQLLMAALGGLPIQSLLGSDSDSEQRGLFFGFDRGGGE